MKASQDAFIQFYQGQQPDNRGRMISEILEWDGELLEKAHDYIQWLFPLRDQSAFNATAPVLDDAQVNEDSCHLAVDH